MNVIGWIIFGLIVGIIAKFLMPCSLPGDLSLQLYSVLPVLSWAGTWDASWDSMEKGIRSDL